MGSRMPSQVRSTTRLGPPQEFGLEASALFHLRLRRLVLEEVAGLGQRPTAVSSGRCTPSEKASTCSTTSLAQLQAWLVLRGRGSWPAFPGPASPLRAPPTGASGYLPRLAGTKSARGEGSRRRPQAGSGDSCGSSVAPPGTPPNTRQRSPGLSR